MSITRNLFHFLLLLFAASCAKQTSPTGGPKDTIPPILIKVYPQNQQTNFREKKIELTFNEIIQLVNPKEQIMITPDIGKEYEITSNKKKATLQFKNQLNDSTTYSINFRDAIQDITEKNPTVNLKVAFSSGSYIDSLSIEGFVYDLQKNKEVKEATVALYQSDTFNIFKHRPIYITKSNQKGIFSIENLKPGNYFVYALEDKSKNLIVDSKTESYGFLTDTIALTSNKKGLAVPLTKLDSRPLKLTSTRPYNTYFNIKTSKNLAEYKIQSPEKFSIASSFGEDYGNIRIYNTLTGKDSTEIHFQASDSIKNSIDTTFFVKFNKRDVKPEAFSVTKEKFQVILNSGIISGKVKFNKPLEAITYDSILFKLDSVKTITFSADDFKWDSLHNILSIHKKFDKTIFLKPKEPENKTSTQQQPKPTSSDKTTPKNISNQLYFGKSTFISIEKDSSNRIQETITPLKLEDTGILYAEAKTTEPNILLQLLDKSFTLIQTIPNTKKVAFEDLPPGDYLIRLVIDKNNDGKWSPGNFFEKREPEPIRYYKNEKSQSLINLKANWEIDKLLIEY